MEEVADPVNSVTLTLHDDKQCALWDCMRVHADGSRYCCIPHMDFALAERTIQRPHNMANVRSFIQLDKLVIPKLVNHLRNPALGITGISNLQHLNVLNASPLDQHIRFPTDLDEREEFNIWVFIWRFVPNRQLWRQGNDTRRGNYVRTRFYRLFPAVGGTSWRLFRYTINSNTVALYAMEYCKSLAHPPPVVGVYYRRTCVNASDGVEYLNSATVTDLHSSKNKTEQNEMHSEFLANKGVQHHTPARDLMAYSDGMISPELLSVRNKSPNENPNWISDPERMVNSGNEKSIRISGLRSRPWDEIRNAANKRKTPPCSHELHPKSKARKQKPDAERAAKRELLRGVSKNVYKQKRPSSIFMEKSVVLPDFEFQSPVFRYEAPISSPSPSFTKRTSKETTCQARRFPDFSGKTRDYYFGREFSGDDLGLEEREAASANLKDNGHVVISPSSLISKVIHITPSSQHSEMDEEEVFGRAVALFIMAFQKFEKKLKLAAEKKCSEIIASVSEEIHLEVEDINRGKKTSYLAKTQGKTPKTLS
ncbi:unnamed protein product [Arabidopsis lyrata]|nr:unnamed protein product [Arabidopsis lyrata]